MRENIDQNYATHVNVNVISAIGDKLSITMYSRVKIAAPARFKIDDLTRVSKSKTIFTR